MPVEVAAHRGEPMTPAALRCPMCGTAIDANSIAGVCGSCPLYRAKSGCCIDLIACPQCGYHSLPREHRASATVSSGGAPRGMVAGVPHPGSLPVVRRAAAPAAPSGARAAATPPPPRPLTAADCAGARRLTEIPAGGRARLLGFSAVNDAELGRLTAYGLLPGVIIEVVQRFPAVILAVYQAELALENGLAENVWVLPEPGK